MASSENSMAHQNYQQQQVLKCPRCDSSNTKFCYYNNYSLSQPRHFCKACKRYWTRGGTLRNVPVGGGCRKINKRSIKTTTKTTTYTTLVDHTPNPNPNSNSRSDQSTPSNSYNTLNPLYGLLQENPKYPRFNARVSDTRGLNVSRYDLVQPKMSSVGLGFSSVDHGHNSVSLVSSYPSIFGGEFTSNSSSNSDHTLSSILSSRLHQQSTLPRFSPYGDGVGSVVNEIQMEGQKSSMDWNSSLNIGQSQNDQTKALESFDPTSLLWTISGGDGKVEDWGDPTSNISIPSLI